MEQLTMGRVTDPAAADAWARLYSALIEACVLITPKELAHRLDIAPSYLTEALHGKNNKGFRLEWLPTVLLMAPVDNVAAILRALCDLRGFAVERKRQMTEAEELAALREWMHRKASAVLQMADKEIGK